MMAGELHPMLDRNHYRLDRQRIGAPTALPERPTAVG
jgi:hypothetical protein